MTDKVSYSKPRVVDYGDLRELTMQGGGGFTDVPLGSPVDTKSQPGP